MPAMESKLITMTHVLKNGNEVLFEIRQAQVVIDKTGRNETLLKMNLELTRQIGDRNVKYFYLLDKTTNQTSERTESILNHHDFYLFEQDWSRMWDPELPYAQQINDSAKMYISSYEPIQRFAVKPPATSSIFRRSEWDPNGLVGNEIPFGSPEGQKTQQLESRQNSQLNVPMQNMLDFQGNALQEGNRNSQTEFEHTQVQRHQKVLSEEPDSRSPKIQPSSPSSEVQSRQNAPSKEPYSYSYYSDSFNSSTSPQTGSSYSSSEAQNAPSMEPDSYSYYSSRSPQSRSPYSGSEVQSRPFKEPYSYSYYSDSYHSSSSPQRASRNKKGQTEQHPKWYRVYSKTSVAIKDFHLCYKTHKLKNTLTF